MVLVVKALLSLLADVQDCLDSGDRVLAAHCFCTQQDAIAAIQHSVRNVCGLSPARNER